MLLYAHRREPPEHPRYARWLEELIKSPEPFALSDLIASAFLRVATNSKAFQPASTFAVASAFVESLRARSNCVTLRPGPDNWAIFLSLCRASGAHGKLLADAYHAALAIEHGCELVTADADFARFPGLRWHHPLAPAR